MSFHHDACQIEPALLLLPLGIGGTAPLRVELSLSRPLGPIAPQSRIVQFLGVICQELVSARRRGRHDLLKFEVRASPNARTIWQANSANSAMSTGRLR